MLNSHISPKAYGTILNTAIDWLARDAGSRVRKNQRGGLAGIV
jgi:hypothetical protein